MAEMEDKQAQNTKHAEKESVGKGRGAGGAAESGGGYGNHATGGQDGERTGDAGAASSEHFGVGPDKRQAEPPGSAKAKP